MKRQNDQLVEVAITPRQKRLMLEHSVLGGRDNWRPLRTAIKGNKLIVELTLDDLNDLICYTAEADVEAHQAGDKELEKELGQILKQLQTPIAPDAAQGDSDHRQGLSKYE